MSCVLATLVLPNAISFLCYQIHFGNFYFYFYTMVVVPLKEIKLIIVVDDLDFKIKDVAFKAKVFNRYGTFDRITNTSMENLGYAYLHYDYWTRQL